MHIADGILPVGLCAAAGAASLAGTVWWGRGVHNGEVARMGLMASTLFTASLIHFPLAGTSVHFSLLGLAGLLLGTRAFPVVFATLLMQALLFQHGGLLSLGVNALNMGGGALVAAALWRILPGGVRPRVFLCSFAATMTAALLMAAGFAAAGYGKGFYWIAGVYSLLALIEAALTVMIVDIVRKVRPEVVTA
jgi:cobalt/nickel transport system permease protein